MDRRILTVSLGTIPRPDGADLRRKLREIRDVFDFVKFGDNPRARARVSPWAAAAVALGQGVAPIVHVGCRDRNRLALQSDLLGGRLLGVRNVLCLRGDEIEVSDQPDTLAVRDLDVVDLIGLAADDFCVLAACDPAVEMSDEHAARLRTKIAAGAQLLETQPVFDPDGFARWLRDLREAGRPVHGVEGRWRRSAARVAATMLNLFAPELAHDAPKDGPLSRTGRSSAGNAERGDS